MQCFILVHYMNEFYSTHDIARILAVSAGKVRSLIYDGRILAINIGKAQRRIFRIPPSSLQDFLDASLFVCNKKDYAKNVQCKSQHTSGSR